MSRIRFRGFLSKQEKRYLQFLRYTERYGHEVSNRASWNEKTPYRSLDHQIRRKTKLALEDWRLVLEKFGYMKVESVLSDVEVLNNIKLLNETVEFVETQRETRRLERETG